MLFSKNIKAGFFVACTACFLATEIWANNSAVLIKKVNFTKENQLEISLSKKTDFKIFTLQNPERLVVDIANANFENSLEKPIKNPDQQIVLPNFISSFRSKKSDQNHLRLVFDLNQKVSIQKARFEKIKQENSGKIIAEISGVKNSFVAKIEPKENTTESNDNKSSDAISEKVAEFDIETRKVINADGSAKYIVKKIPKNVVTVNALSQKTPIIVIDSGHGGKDPGTIGIFARTKEKNLTLSYAKELAKQLMKSKRYEVYLTRNDDRFIPLRKRVELARKKKADLFISLHANAIDDEAVAGFSIYTLSEKSSDKQAELLAQKENRADIINGINFSNASWDIVKTLIDLSQRETMNGSARFANLAIKSIKKSEINILQNTHRFAGFAVLTAPDMISVLIELGYLSSKEEEKLLNSVSYKRRVAESLAQAIDEYFFKK